MLDVATAENKQDTGQKIFNIIVFIIFVTAVYCCVRTYIDMGAIVAGQDSINTKLDILLKR